MGWLDAHPWVLNLAFFGVVPVLKWLWDRDRSHAADMLVLRGEVQVVRNEAAECRSRLALHKQEDATTHAHLEGELARLREQLAALPTARDLHALTSAIERSRGELADKISQVGADVRVVATRLDGLGAAQERVQVVVDRHESVISDAAARRRRGDDGRD